MTEFSTRLAAIIAAIPAGTVMSYGQAAALAGNPRAARQVVRFLNSSASSLGLPWHRMVRKDGSIALPPGPGFDLQLALLRAEGQAYTDQGRPIVNPANAFPLPGPAAASGPDWPPCIPGRCL